MESANRHGLEPRAYLLHLLQTLPHSTNQQIPSLTPEAVAIARQRQQRQQQLLARQAQAEPRTVAA